MWAMGKAARGAATQVSQQKLKGESAKAVFPDGPCNVLNTEGAQADTLDADRTRPKELCVGVNATPVVD